MTISNFDKRLLIEQIRYIEAKQKLVCDAEQEFADPAGHRDFEQRLWLRARCLVQQHDLTSHLTRAARRSRYLRAFAMLAMALLGAFAVSYAVTDSATINIYWLLLVLLGFNVVSMMLWFTGISLNVEGLTSGLFARLSGRISAYLDSKNTAANLAEKQADRAWLSCNFSGAVGRWQLSKLTHQLWLAYLLTGLIFLILLLMVRQYDFVWGTTLLSDTVFVRLTEFLSVPLDALGFATPTAEQVQQTRIGAIQNGVLQSSALQTLTAEHRSHWAQFLLGALLIFGIVPRILLLGFSALMCTRHRHAFVLDFYLPYYVSLRQRLLPLASHGLVVDADTSAPVIASSSIEVPAATPVPHALPEETRWVAVELGDETGWPPHSVSSDNNLGQVIDRESLSHIQQRLQLFDRPLVAVAVSASRAPDRGIQRTIASLMSDSGQRWLVLLQPQLKQSQQKPQPGEEPISSKRLASWYRLAEACNVPADHVISMSLA